MDYETINEIRLWAKKHGVTAVFDTYLFGSLVENDGQQFNPASSDVDLALVLRADDGSANYLKRVQAVDKLKDAAAALELLLVRRFHRKSADDCVASLVVLTQAEKTYALHKGKDSELLTGSRFLKLTTNKISKAKLISVSDDDDSNDFEKRNKECASVMQEVQNARNAYLMVALNDTPALQPFDDGNDPLPKKMMRSAAMLAYIESGKADPKQRVDLAIGGEYVAELVRAQKNVGAVSELHQALGVRRALRGTKRALSGYEQLLMWELLFDKAIELKRPTKGEEMAEFADFPRSKQ